MKCSLPYQQGTFESTVMFFGLTNSPATFHTMMNDILRDLINEGNIMAYLDDILIFSDDLFKHQQLVKRVLQHLQEHSLCIKKEKCIFERSSVNYLGIIVGNGKVQMDPTKVTTVAD